MALHPTVELSKNSHSLLWVLMPHQVSPVVVEATEVNLCKYSVNRRPFLLSDLHQRGLILETSAARRALGKRASNKHLEFQGKTK